MMHGMVVVEVNAEAMKLGGRRAILKTLFGVVVVVVGVGGHRQIAYVLELTAGPNDFGPYVSRVALRRNPGWSCHSGVNYRLDVSRSPRLMG